MKQFIFAIALMFLFGTQNVLAVDEFQATDLEDYDFTIDPSYYTTDEQMQEAQEIDVIENKTDFRTKIINSGHFTSDTATKTYIPINKIQK